MERAITAVRPDAYYSSMEFVLLKVGTLELRRSFG